MVSFSFIRFALHTLWHHRIVSACFGLLISSYLISIFLVQLIVSGHTKVIIDFSCGAFYLFVLLFNFIFVINYFHYFKSHHSYEWLLTSGWTRTSFIIYSYLACILVQLIAALIFYGAAVVFTWYQTSFSIWYCWPCFCVYVCEASVLTSLAVFFSIIVSLYVTYFTLLGTYILCLINHSWYQLLIQKEDSFLKYVQLFISYLIPDFKLLDIHAAVLYEKPIDATQLTVIVFYCLCFSIILMYSSIFLFNKKNI